LGIKQSERVSEQWKRVVMGLRGGTLETKEKADSGGEVKIPQEKEVVTLSTENMPGWEGKGLVWERKHKTTVEGEEELYPKISHA